MADREHRHSSFLQFLVLALLLLLAGAVVAARLYLTSRFAANQVAAGLEQMLGVPVRASRRCRYRSQRRQRAAQPADAGRRRSNSRPG